MILNILVCSIGPDQPNAMCVVGRIMVEQPRGPQRWCMEDPNFDPEIPHVISSFALALGPHLDILLKKENANLKKNNGLKIVNGLFITFLYFID